MLVKKSEMLEVYHTALTASPEHIKSLDQPERKALRVMLEALKMNKDSVQSDLIQTNTLADLKSKFTLTPPPHVPSNWIMSIFKGIFNFFGWRVGSAALQKDIAFISTYGTKAVYEEIKAARNQVKNDMKKVKLPLKEIKTLVSTKKDVETLDAGHTQQFRLDYTRGGPLLTVDDPTKGFLQGKVFKDCHKEDHFHFYTEGLSKIFAPTEKKWMHLAEANACQTPFNSLGIPLLKMLTTEDGRLNTFIIGGAENNLNIKHGEELAHVKVVRDTYGNIQKLEISQLLDTEVRVEPSNIVLGHVRSTLSYSVSFQEDGVTPKIKNLKRKQEFVESPALKETKTEQDTTTTSVTPGYHPIKTEEPSTANYVKDLIENWKKDLSDLKLSLKSTTEKITRLKKRIEDAEKTVSNPGMGMPESDQTVYKQEMPQVISDYKKYLAALESTN